MYRFPLFWVLAGAATLAVVGGAFSLYPRRGLSEGPVKVGVLHSLSGPLAANERPLVDATLLAIEEVNLNGGLLGRPVEPLVADGASSALAFASAAEELLGKEKVVTVFGCWSSSSRRTVRDVVEKHENLLVYPMQSEGLEQSPHIIYTGSVPNQTVVPAVNWALENLGRRFYLVGSDSLYTRTVHPIIEDQIAALGGRVLGKDIFSDGDGKIDEVADRIVSARPVAILSTLNVIPAAALLGRLKQRGMDATHIPAFLFGLSEEEMPVLTKAMISGHYVAASYFQSIDTPENRRFVQAFKDRYGSARTTGDAMQTAYFGVHLWARAVNAAQSLNPRLVAELFLRQSLNAPEGAIYVDPTNQHTWRRARIGRLLPNGQFELIWQSGKPVAPVPYSSLRSQDEWDYLLKSIYRGWGNRWSAPLPEAFSASR